MAPKFGLKLEIDNGTGFEEYTSYLVDGGLQIEDLLNQPTLLSFTVVNSSRSFVIPRVSAYVRLSSRKYQNVIATGFITQVPTKTYISLSGMRSSEPFRGAFIGYEVKVTSDEWLLNVKTIPFLPAFVNQTMGAILRQVAEALVPNFYTYDLADGDNVPFFQYDPTKQWSEYAKTFADSIRYRYNVLDKKISLKPIGDAPLGVSYDESITESFDPKRLDTTVFDIPIINDAIIIGDVEPHKIREDHFIGDGFTADFTLRHKVFGGETALLLQEKWDGEAISTDLWDVLDPDAQIALSNGALNFTGGTSLSLGERYVKGKNGLELGGHLDIDNGEFTFLGGSGIIGGIYNAAALTQVNCEIGFYVNGGVGGTISPVVDGAVGASMVTIASGKHYRLQTFISAGQWTRYNKLYRTLSGQEFGGTELASVATVTFVVEITDDLPEPTVIKHSEDMTLSAFGLYAVVNSVNIQLSATFTQIAKPIQGSLYARALKAATTSQPDPLSGSTASDSELQLPVRITAAEPEEHCTLGFGLQNQTATIATVNDYQKLRFYADTIPIPGARIRLRTWEAGKALARVRDNASVSTTAVISGDDGVRSAIVSDLNPLPRTSEDCDQAASTFVKDHTTPQYNGKYQFSDIFWAGFIANVSAPPISGAVDYPRSGRIFTINSPTRNIASTDFIARRIRWNVLELKTERIDFELEFGPDLFLQKLLPKFLKSGEGILEPKDAAERPDIQDINDVGLFYLADIVNAKVSSLITGASGFTVDASQEDYNGADKLQVRRTDSGWGKTTPNIIANINAPATTFTLTRESIEQTYYMRLWDGVEGGKTSRRTTAIRVVYPLVPDAPIGELDVRDYLKPEVHLQLQGDIRNVYGIEIRSCMVNEFSTITSGISGVVDVEAPIEVFDQGVAGEFSVNSNHLTAAPTKYFTRAEFPFDPSLYAPGTFFYFEAIVTNASFTESRKIYIEKEMRGRSNPTPTIVQTFTVPPQIFRKRIRFSQNWTGWRYETLPNLAGGQGPVVPSLEDMYRVYLDREAPYVTAGGNPAAIYPDPAILPTAPFEVFQMRLIAQSVSADRAVIEIPLSSLGETPSRLNEAAIAYSSQSGTYEDIPTASIFEFVSSEWDYIRKMKLFATIQVTASTNTGGVVGSVGLFDEADNMVAEASLDTVATGMFEVTNLNLPSYWQTETATVSAEFGLSGGIGDGKLRCKIKVTGTDPDQNVNFYKARLWIQVYPMHKLNSYWRYAGGAVNDTFRILYSKGRNGSVDSEFIEATGKNATIQMIDGFTWDGQDSAYPGWFGYNSGDWIPAQNWTVEKNFAPVVAQYNDYKQANQLTLDYIKDAERKIKNAAWQFELFAATLPGSGPAAGITAINALRDTIVAGMETDYAALLATVLAQGVSLATRLDMGSTKDVYRKVIDQNLLKSTDRFYGSPVPITVPPANSVKLRPQFLEAIGAQHTGSWTTEQFGSGSVNDVNPFSYNELRIYHTSPFSDMGALVIYGFPEPVAPIVSATVYTVTQFINAPSGGSPNAEIHVFPYNPGNNPVAKGSLGATDLSGGGGPDNGPRLGSFTMTTSWPGANNLYLQMIQWHSLVQDFPIPAKYRLYDVWIEYDYGDVEFTQSLLSYKLSALPPAEDTESALAIAPGDILFRRVFKSPTDLAFVFDNKRYRIRHLCFEAYIFNLMWEYSQKLELRAFLAPPPAPIMDIVSITSGIITIRLDIVQTEDTHSVEVQMSTTPAFVGRVVKVKGGPLQSIYALEVPPELGELGEFIRARRRDYLGYSDWSAILFIGADAILTSGSGSIVSLPGGNTGTPPTSVTSIPSGLFTYTATDSSVTWSWSQFTLTYSDGFQQTVPAGTHVFTGLIAGTTYKFYPYLDGVRDAAGTVVILLSTVDGGTGEDTEALITTTQDGNLPLSSTGFMEATTANTGGSTSGSGGGTVIVGQDQSIAIAITLPGVMPGDGKTYDVAKASVNPGFGWKFVAGLASWRGNTQTSPGATAVLSLKRNGTQFGTVTISTGGAMTFASAADAVFLDNDLFSVTTSTDIVIQDVNITAYGVKILNG